MLIPIISVVVGLLLLVWSAEHFVSGSAAVAKHFGMSPLLIGMVIIGFGTSAPEMVVSAISAHQGDPGIALGNAYGSNITNIALILGLTALFKPVVIHSQILRKELPILMLITLLTIGLLYDLDLSRLDAIIMLLVFFIIMGLGIVYDLRNKGDTLSQEMQAELQEYATPLGRASLQLGIGLVVLVLSSRSLVWGAVHLAQLLGVSNVVIGLTVVAIGTSLPELASSIVAAKKGESDIVLGNILGSNLFNTLAVVGIAGSIHPLLVEQKVLYRDILVMSILTLLLVFFCYGFKKRGKLSRIEGSLFVLSYICYTVYLVNSAIIQR